MYQDPIDSGQDVVEGRVEQRDSKSITDLIEQLDRDLIETQKNACKRG